jgi:hypothetical protein
MWVQTLPMQWIFNGNKNPHHTFLQMGSKARGFMLKDFTACK